MASALIEVDENLSEVSKKLNSGSLSSLEKEELDEVYAKLTARKSTLTALHDTLTITATVDGIVGSVNVSANSSVSQSSSGSTSNSTSNSTNSSDSNSATGTSSGMSKLSSSLLNLTASSTGTEEASVVTDFSKLLIPAPKTGEKGISSIDEEKTREQGYKVSSITWVRP